MYPISLVFYNVGEHIVKHLPDLYTYNVLVFHHFQWVNKECQLTLYGMQTYFCSCLFG